MYINNHVGGCPCVFTAVRYCIISKLVVQHCNNVPVMVLKVVIEGKAWSVSVYQNDM